MWLEKDLHRKMLNDIRRQHQESLGKELRVIFRRVEFLRLLLRHHHQRGVVFHHPCHQCLREVHHTTLPADPNLTLSYHNGTQTPCVPLCEAKVLQPNLPDHHLVIRHGQHLFQNQTGNVLVRPPNTSDLKILTNSILDPLLVRD